MWGRVAVVGEAKVSERGWVTCKCKVDFFSRVSYTQLLWIYSSQYGVRPILVHSEHDYVRLYVEGAVVAYFYSDCMYLARLLYPIPSWFSSTE